MTPLFPVPIGTRRYMRYTGCPAVEAVEHLLYLLSGGAA